MKTHLALITISTYLCNSLFYQVWLGLESSKNPAGLHTNNKISGQAINSLNITCISYFILFIFFIFIRSFARKYCEFVLWSVNKTIICTKVTIQKTEQQVCTGILQRRKNYFPLLFHQLKLFSLSQRLLSGVRLLLVQQLYKTLIFFNG